MNQPFWEPEIIGSGSYGFIHRPPLLLSDDKREYVDYENKVSKLLTQKDAVKEVEKHRILLKVDPELNFHLGFPVYGTPHVSSVPYIAKAVQGNPIDIKRNLDASWALLIMPDGGPTIARFSNYMYKQNQFTTPNIRQSVNNFWLESFRMVFAINELVGARIVHHDMKHQNILYDEMTQRMNLIDMNMVENMGDIIQEANSFSGYNLGIFYFNLPPELVFFQKNDFEALQSFDYDKCEYYWKSIYLSEKEFQNVVGNEKEYDEDSCIKYFNNVFYLIDRDHHLISEIDSDYIKWKRRQMFPDESSDCSGVSTVSDEMEDISEQESLLEFEKSELPLRDFMVYQFRRFMFYDSQIYSYETFLEESVSTIDIFGLGSAYLYCLVRTYKYLDHRFAMEMYDLIRRMLDTNIRSRIHIDQLVDEYIRLLNKYFDVNIP